ncbi:MAG: sulfatase-like hydrolase/transferase [Pirellulaceae bacterium]
MSHPIYKSILFVVCCVMALSLTPVVDAQSRTTGNPSQDAPPRPNILMIITDDQGEWTLGATGNRDAVTPNMDRLAREGTRLSNAFVVTPVCSPSRVATITGRYASEFGILDWINPNSEQHLGLDAEAMTWPRLLADVGYRTGLVGKWHLGLQPHHHPTAFGYESFAGFLEGGNSTRNPTLSIDGVSRVREGLCVDLLTDLAIDFIQQAPDERPWCLSLHYRAPHGAYLPVQEEVWEHFREKPVQIADYPDLDRSLVSEHMREYLASIADIDRNLQRVLDLLDELQVASNTLVIFTSDHGYNLGHHGLEYKGNAYWRLNQEPRKIWPEVAAKRRPNMFDTSLRVPAVIRWPGHVPAGKTVEAWTSNLDWFPTLCEIAGVDSAKTGEVPLRGQSLWPALRGEAATIPASGNEMYFEYSMRHGSQTDMRALRTDDWKYMRDFKNPGRVELYNLRQDPGELENLAHLKTPEVQTLISKFDARLAAKMHEISDPLVSSISPQP